MTADRVVSTAEQWDSLAYKSVIIALGALFFVVCRAVRRAPEAVPGLDQRSGSAGDAAAWWLTWYLVAFGAMFAIAPICRALGMASSPGVWADAQYGSWVLLTVSVVLAGFAEEPLLAALPVLLLGGRVQVRYIVLLGAAMRALLHLYYGVPGAVWAAIWGGAAVWVYYRFRRLWVLVLVHGLLNATSLGFLVSPDASHAGGAVKVALFGLGVWWVIRTERRTPPQERTPPVPDLVELLRRLSSPARR